MTKQKDTPVLKHGPLQQLFLRICNDVYGTILPEDVEAMIESLEELGLRRFRIPTYQEVCNYMVSRQWVEPENMSNKFINHYQARGWKYSGNTAMKDWKAAVRTWEDKGAPRINNENKPQRIV